MCEGSEMERGGGNTSLCESGAGLPVELGRCEWDFFIFSGSHGKMRLL